MRKLLALLAFLPGTALAQPCIPSAAIAPDGRVLGHLPYGETPAETLVPAPAGFALRAGCRVRPEVAAALEEVTAEVEDTYAVAVETVVVGDADLDERLAALVQATREALVNAARHAKVAEVSLYAEVEPAGVSVYVRDRGIGFDRGAVPGDRHGIDGSIIGRMRRHGGTAAVRSSPGAGTEVELSIGVGG